MGGLGGRHRRGTGQGGRRKSGMKGKDWRKCWFMRALEHETTRRMKYDTKTQDNRSNPVRKGGNYRQNDHKKEGGVVRGRTAQATLQPERWQEQQEQRMLRQQVSEQDWNTEPRGKLRIHQKTTCRRRTRESHAVHRPTRRVRSKKMRRANRRGKRYCEKRSSTTGKIIGGEMGK